jgi:hypothetical protein
VLELHLSRYPEMQLEDLYKLLHQAALGSEHAVSDRDAARRWLQREIEALTDAGTASRDEPLMESLSPDGRLVRVNLRPFLRTGGDPEALLAAVVETAEQYQGDPAILDRYCQRAVTLAREEDLPFTPAALEARFAELQGQGYPAGHHSKTYKETYRPAYRVVLRDLLGAD